MDGAPSVSERGSLLGVDICVGLLVMGYVVVVGVGTEGMGMESDLELGIVRDRCGDRGHGRGIFGWRGIFRAYLVEAFIDRAKDRT